MTHDTKSFRRSQRINNSKNYKNGSFVNLSPTKMKPDDVSYITMLRKTLHRPNNTRPNHTLPVIKTDLKSLPNDAPVIVWFGHSAYLIHFRNKNILIDPGFSGYASPFSFMVKAFDGANSYSANDMPIVDLLIITHDHYDHLDVHTIKELAPKIKSVCTSLGVGERLESLLPGVPVTELDWWESASFGESKTGSDEIKPPSDNISLSTIEIQASSHNISLATNEIQASTQNISLSANEIQASTQNISLSSIEMKVKSDVIKITACPARHFSGRSLKRNGSLWSSFVINLPGYSIFAGGDSGYDFFFKEIGDRFGPFDIALLECGQYNQMWPMIHMMPEQTAQAAKDLQAKWLLPVHWSKFALALHPWNEPIKRVKLAAEQLKLNITTPKIGQPVTLGVNYPQEKWFEESD